MGGKERMVIVLSGRALLTFRSFEKERRLGEGGGRRDEKSLQGDLGQVEEGIEGGALFHSSDQGWNVSVSSAGKKTLKMALLMGYKLK